MSERTAIQSIAAEVVSFFEWFGESLGDPLVRDSMIKDLGGDPAEVPDGTTVPSTGLDTVKAFRDASNVTLEQGIQALADMAVLLDAIASIAETFAHSAGAGAQELGHSLLELAASNYVRVRFPRLFLVLQLASLLEEVTSTYGEGTNNVVRLGSSIAAVWGFLVQPGKSLAQADPSREDPDDPFATMIDVGFRLAAVILAIYNGVQIDKGKATSQPTDALSGWDGPGVDVDSDQLPALSDLISERMTSFSLGLGTGAVPTGGNAAGRLNISIATIPSNEGQTALFIALGGSGDIEQPLGQRWQLSLKARADAGVAAILGLSNTAIAGPADGSVESVSIGLASRPKSSSQLSFSIPSETGSRLEIGTVSFTATVASTGAEYVASLADSALVIDSDDSDGFIAELLGNTPLRLPFGLALGYSSSRGLILEGSAPPTGTAPARGTPLTGAGNVGAPVLAATIPIGRTFGPITVHEVALRVTRGPADALPRDMNLTTIEVDTSLSAQIGPVYLRVDQLGLQVRVDGSKPPAERNLRLVHLEGPGIKFPRGVAVQVDTALITGGGSILHDDDLGLYFGTVDLCFRGGTALKALGVIATRDAGGAKSFSMLIILTVEFATPYPLPFGFRLEGVGGMLALHRTFDEAATRAALPTGQLRNVLFPPDPVHHTTEVLASLQSLFPARRGSHLLGVLVRIGWGAPTLIRFDLAVLYEFGNRHRLILLGQVSALLPRLDSPLITLNMDAVGVLDFDAGTFALDAVLHDSKLLSRYVISGAMAMRMTWHDSFGLALAVGGLHPRFTAPAGFPAVAPLQLALTNGDNPKLICQGYFGITSNTVQFGASCSLYAAAYGFSIQGDVGFDVLVQIIPFHFVADFRASVQLKRGSHNLFKVSVSGELEGPLPLRLSGKATFEILWCDFSVSFNKTLVGGDPDQGVAVDALALLRAALADPQAWRSELPPAGSQLVTVRSPVVEGILVHPQGTLTVRQSVLPLGLTRDVDRIGSGVPVGERRFTITQTVLGPVPQSTTNVVEMFAPGQFFDMSDDDRLAAPSFEPMNAGVSFRDGGYTTDFAAAVKAPFEYTDIVVGPDGVPVVQPDTHVQDGGSVLVMTQRSAAALARTRSTLAARFQAPPIPGAPAPETVTWAAVAVDTRVVADTGPTWAEAKAQVTDRTRWVLVPRNELLEALR